MRLEEREEGIWEMQMKATRRLLGDYETILDTPQQQQARKVYGGERTREEGSL